MAWQALFATHLKDVAKLRIHVVALDFGQGQPGGKQLVVPGLGHGGKVELAKHCAPRKVAGQQRVGHLPEKVSGRVVTGHVVLPAGR
jgi:hypothetical protein